MTLDNLPQEVWDRTLKFARLKDLWSFHEACQKSRSHRYISPLTADRASRILLDNIFSCVPKECLIISGEDTRTKINDKRRKDTCKARKENYKNLLLVSLTVSKASYEVDKRKEDFRREHKRDRLGLCPERIESEIHNIAVQCPLQEGCFATAVTTGGVMPRLHPLRPKHLFGETGRSYSLANLISRGLWITVPTSDISIYGLRVTSRSKMQGPQDCDDHLHNGVFGSWVVGRQKGGIRSNQAYSFNVATTAPVKAYSYGNIV